MALQPTSVLLRFCSSVFKKGLLLPAPKSQNSPVIVLEAIDSGVEKAQPCANANSPFEAVRRIPIPAPSAKNPRPSTPSRKASNRHEKGVPSPFCLPPLPVTKCPVRELARPVVCQSVSKPYPTRRWPGGLDHLHRHDRHRQRTISIPAALGIMSGAAARASARVLTT